jgi:dihydroorotate dehydrogenase (NAD+) catalytic subunit
LAGASIVQVGTAIFKDPNIPLDIVKGIEEYMDRHKVQSVSELIGGLQL